MLGLQDHELSQRQSPNQLSHSDNCQISSLSNIKRFKVLIDLDEKYEKHNEKYNLKSIHECMQEVIMGKADGSSCF